MAEVLGATLCRHYSPDRVRAVALSQLRILGEVASCLIGLGRIQQAKLQTPPLTSHGAPGHTSCQPAEHDVTPVPTPVQQCIHTSLTALAAIRWIVSQFGPDMYMQLLAEPIHATLEVLNIMLVPCLSDLTIDMTKVLQLGMPVLIQAAMHSPLIQHRQLEAVLVPLMLRLASHTELTDAHVAICGPHLVDAWDAWESKLAPMQKGSPPQ